MRIGTDCSGIEAPIQAFERLGIPFEHTFACDIDKFVKIVSDEIYKPKKFYPDLTTRNHKEVPKLDLYVAGFPCQAFSMAGKRKGFDDIRGSVFFHVADFIRINRPKVFILENVKGLLSHDSGRTHQTIIDVLAGNGTINGQMSIPLYDDGLDYHIYWQVLNTKEHGIPQNRERWFCVGFEQSREFRFPKTEELKLRLKDVLEDDVDEKYYLSENMLESISKWKSNQNPLDKVFTGEDVMSCVLARGDGEVHSGMKLITHSLFPRSSKTGKGGSGHLSKEDGTSYAVDTGCSQGVEVIQLNQSKESGGAQPYQQNRVYDKDGLSPSILSQLGGDPMHNINTDRIRRLTPLECFRLQDFPDEFFFQCQGLGISDTQLYKMAGNSMTVRVVEKIMRKIYE